MEIRQTSSVVPAPAAPPNLGLQAGNIALRPVLRSDVDWLLQLESHPAIIQRFRLGGSTPSTEKYIQLLQHGVLCSFLVVNAARNQPIGLVYAYNAELKAGRATVAFVSDPEYKTDGPRDFFRGVFLFMNYLFETFSLKKIYGEAAAFNFDQFENNDSRSIDLTNLFTVEAVLPKHAYFRGSWWDTYLVGLDRDDWSEHYPVMLEQMHMDMLLVETLPGGERDTNATDDVDDRQSSAKVDPLRSSNFRLRPVTGTDERWAASLFLHPENRLFARVPIGGKDPKLTRDDVHSLLWEGVLCQFVIEDSLNGVPIGLVTAHKAEWIRQTMGVHLMAEPSLLQDEVFENATALPWIYLRVLAVTAALL